MKYFATETGWLAVTTRPLKGFEGALFYGAEYANGEVTERPISVSEFTEEGTPPADVITALGFDEVEENTWPTLQNVPGEGDNPAYAGDDELEDLNEPEHCTPYNAHRAYQQARLAMWKGTINAALNRAAIVAGFGFVLSLMVPAPIVLLGVIALTAILLKQ